MGLKNKSDTVYIIDYGLSKSYINPKTDKHIAFDKINHIVGTLRYCSLNSQMGFEQGRRDDLESLEYSLIYMLKGKLPWKGLKGVGKIENNKSVMETKSKTSIKELCKELPLEMSKFMIYCKTLQFHEDLNHSEQPGFLTTPD